MSVDAWSSLKGRMEELADLQGVLATLSWDQETQMPPKGAAARAAQTGRLARLRHERFTDPDVGRWLAEIAELPTKSPDQEAALRNIGRDYRKATKVPADLVAALSEGAAHGFQAWLAARKANDFEVFRESLEHLVSLRQQICEVIDPNAHPYELLLQEFDPGTSVVELRQLFARLTGGLRELIEAIDGVEPLPSFGDRFPVQGQRKAFRRVAEAMGYDLTAGRIDISEHPFTTSLGPGDTRITIRVFEDDLLGGLGPTIHEAGHALYEQGLPWDKVGSSVGQAAGMGLHESQSRLWENFIGRSAPFMRWFGHEMESVFAGRSVDADALFRAANRVAPTLTRVEADEVTYNLHVGIRFELELALLEGSLEVRDLPAAWNDSYEKVLGIRPPDDLTGVLQDVHWSHGMFGYFPSYTLGNLYAASMGATLEEHIPTLWQDVERGDFGNVLSWLRERVHSRGHVHDAPRLVADAVGERDHVEDLLSYLWSRHGLLHGVTRPLS